MLLTLQEDERAPLPSLLLWTTLIRSHTSSNLLVQIPLLAFKTQNKALLIGSCEGEPQ